MKINGIYYGWPLVGIGFVVYGLGMAPAYYSWGFLAPEMMTDIGITREQVGSMFGTFTLMYAVVSPLAATAMGRFGLRAVVTTGSLIAAVGFWMVGRAESAIELYWSYAFVGGLGLGLSTILPAQAIPIFWFQRFRARATAIILLGAAVFGAFVTPVDDVILDHWGWRSVWIVIAGVSVVVALVSVLFLRNRPEDIGQIPDGRPFNEPIADAEQKQSSTGPDWSAAQAILTPQFAIVTFAALANALPWRIFTAHGRLHFEDLGFVSTLAAAILGVRVGASAFGRLSASAGDFLRPNWVLSIALAFSGAGMAGLLFAETPLAAYVCVTLLGLGFGAGFVSIPVVFASFFGHRAFLHANGLQIALIGVVGWIGPTWAGAGADQSGNYNGTFFVLTVLCVFGALASFLCRRPNQNAAKHTD